MNQTERRKALIKMLISEQPERYQGLSIPSGDVMQGRLLRGLLNLRPPMPASAEFLRLQDEFLQEEIQKKGITDANSLEDLGGGLSVWRGDITTLRCDGIVNAANSALLGCFCPNHGCIDNAIHTFAGVQLRLACNKLMLAQGHEEPTGCAKITPAFNLPSRYVLHTVGPIVQGHVTQKDKELLASCYRSCLNLAQAHELHSLAFCCISTGEFHFPNKLAAEIAVQTVSEHPAVRDGQMKVIFNVFKPQDEVLYRHLLDAKTPSFLSREAFS